MWSCPNCHAAINQGQTYCGNCKTRLVWQGEQVRVNLVEASAKTVTAVASLVIWSIVLVGIISMLHSCL